MSNGAAIEPYHYGTWTPEQLKAYFDALREADAKAVAAALAAAEKAVDKALVAAATATEKAERNAEKWRESANEWRDAMNDRETKFATRNEVDTRLVSVENILDQLNTFRDKSVARNAAYAAAMIVVFSVISVVLRFM